MVMKYIEGGDLRKYLKTKKLNFKDKLLRLVNIAQGLKDIHQKGLVHRDFHPGNILNSEIHSFITDLGEVDGQKNTEFFEQLKDKKQFLDKLVALDYKTHPSALYTSRRLDFKSLPESQNSKEINEIFYSSDSKQINLEIPADLDQLNLNEEDQQTETQSQVQVPNK
ncbi:3896_t:CDS:2 [Paraglomus occultum]|uniref:non-specific serine/threonine protein kinase n=1 Tax=Paraglomus occultum TaxID=144539 RepID=A0A9N9BFV7_9GLOM|nr:3896_t:CDS:2 [Paraglomus occultum]